MRDLVSVNHLTQRMANLIPMNQHGRRSYQSVLQRTLAIPAQQIYEFHQQMVIARSNTRALTFNMDEIDVVYPLDLPAGFEFSTQHEDWTAPTVTAVDGSTTVTVQSTDDNDLAAFWYDCLWTRLEDSGTYYTYLPIADFTLIELSEDGTYTTFNDIQIPSRLYITVDGVTSIYNEAGNRDKWAKIRIKGITRNGIEDAAETIFITGNKTYKTRNEYKELTSIILDNLSPESARITISEHSFENINLNTHFSKYVDEFRGQERPLRLRLNNTGSRSFIKFSADEAISSEANMSGLVDLIDVAYVELMSSGAATNITDIDLIPNTDRIVAIDDTYLYVYPCVIPFPILTSLDHTAMNTGLKIEVFNKFPRYGDEVDFRVVAEYTSTPATTFRVVLTKPDGTQVIITTAGEIAWSVNGGWITMSENSDFSMFLDPQNPASSRTIETMSFTISQRGNYKIQVQYRTTDDTQLYKTEFIVYAPSVEPLAKIALPAEFQSSLGVSFDSDYYLWLRKVVEISPYEYYGYYGGGYGYYGGPVVSDRVRKLDYFRDYMLIDYDNKRIYLREAYDSVKVEA